MRFNYTWEEVEREGRYTIELEIDYTVTPYRPAKINCDPDDGHPEEGGEVLINEIEVLSVELVDVGMIKKVSELEALYWTKRFEREWIGGIEIELREHKASWDEAALEDKYDHDRERDE